MVAIILVEPEHPGNIGSVCRVMANFAQSELIIINPKCDPRAQEAKNLAKHAQQILADARIVDWSVLDEFAVVAMTAGIPTTDYNLLRTPLTPEEGAAKLLAVKESKDAKETKKRGAALVFGRESTGLRNEELARGDFVITIPTYYQYPSMNLSHSVAVMLYTLYIQKPVSRFTPMPAAEKRVLYQKMDDAIDALPFRVSSMRVTQKKLWKNIFGRATLTKREAYAALGFLKALEQQRTAQPTSAKSARARGTRSSSPTRAR